MTIPPEAQPATNGAGTAESAAAAASVSSSSPATASPGSDLSSLIKEYETKTSAPATHADLSKFLQAFAPGFEHLAEERQTKIQAKLQSDVDEAVKLARGDLPEEKSRLVRGYLRDLCETDPKALEAWENRAKSPDAWKDVCSQANGYLKEAFGTVKTDGVRTDIDRAAASVRNVSTDPPKREQPDPHTAYNMSDRDWAAYKASVEAATQSG